MNTLKKLLDGDFIVNLLVSAAVVTFVVHVLSMLPTLFKHFVEQPGIAIINFVLGIITALFDPAILLALAKLISMKKQVP